jgi:hypothetical protein
MGRAIGGALANAMDDHTRMRVVAVPSTRAEIQLLLDKLDLRLANGEISETVYRQVRERWEKRLELASSIPEIDR